ncbi:MAG: hypothetical protein PUD71_07215 [Lachnospiraceae bacterium]|nr:hypothetical protein [Lachnospiraceae bacterium]MDD6858153.1 hypothetical protein [Lachnospiraceae bacterium]
MSKIEQIITEIEEYIDNCRFQPLSNTKIVVNKEEIEELLAELRLKTPDEIKKYQRIIANKDAILRDAKSKADAMLSKAQEQTSELVSEHEIMQQAYAQANDIVQQATEQAQQILDSATADANAIRTGAVQYTDDVLANLQNIITHSMENINIKYDNLMKSLSTSLDVVNANRQELNAQDEAETAEQGDAEGVSDEYAGDEIADQELEELSEFEDYTVDLDD